MPPEETSSGGWFRKVSGLIVAWKLGEVHRMRRLLQRWEEVPRVKAYVAALVGYVKMYGWPKNLEGDYGLNTCTGLRSYWLQQSLGGEKNPYQTVRTSILNSKLNTVTISIQKSRLKIKQSPFQLIRGYQVEIHHVFEAYGNSGSMRIEVNKLLACSGSMLLSTSSRMKAHIFCLPA